MRLKRLFTQLILILNLMSCESNNEKKHSDKVASQINCGKSRDSLSHLNSDELSDAIINSLKSEKYNCAYFLAKNRNDSNFNSTLLNILVFISIDSLADAEHEVEILIENEEVHCKNEFASFFHTLITVKDENILYKKSFIDSFIENHHTENPDDLCKSLINKGLEGGYSIEIGDYN